MAHDEEAVRCVLTTLRTMEQDPVPNADELADAILSALTAENFHIVRAYHA